MAAGGQRHPGGPDPPLGLPLRPSRGPRPVPRLHTFWACPVARAVRAQLEAALPGVRLERAHLWLLRLPPGGHGLCSRAWALVSLAALHAMEHGRRHLYALRAGPAWPDPGPAGHRVLGGALPPHVFDAHVRQHIFAARDVLVARVCNATAGRFWRNLQDFVDAQGSIPAGWVVGQAHPFIRDDGNGALVLHLPAEAPADF